MLEGQLEGQLGCYIWRCWDCGVLGAGYRVVVEGGQSIGADVAVEDEKANARVHDSVPGAVRRLGATEPKAPR
jgi:hypothetical protein